jgi:hypothetical protein
MSEEQITQSNADTLDDTDVIRVLLHNVRGLSVVSSAPLIEPEEE